MTAKLMRRVLHRAKQIGEAYKGLSEIGMFEKWYSQMLKEEHRFSDEDVEIYLKRGHNGNYVQASTLHRFEGWLAGRNSK